MQKFKNQIVAGVNDVEQTVIELGGEIEKKEVVYDDQIVAPKTLPKTSIVFNLVELEKRPQFPGGEAKMYQFIAKNIQYPHQAKEASIQGKVYIQFVVEIDGELTDIKIIRGVDSLLDTEVLKMVKLMPNWEPGIKKW